MFMYLFTCVQVCNYVCMYMFMYLCACVQVCMHMYALMWSLEVDVIFPVVSPLYFSHTGFL